MTTTNITKQAKPAAVTEAFFTFSNRATISSIIICNQGTEEDTFRIALDVGSSGTTAKDYIYYDLPLAPKDTFIFTGGITLNSADRIAVYSTNGDCSFNACGVENS